MNNFSNFIYKKQVIFWLEMLILSCSRNYSNFHEIKSKCFTKTIIT
jgi:hypothetical protein